jgi:NADH-quinone oxidoreductase subunit J
MIESIYWPSFFFLLFSLIACVFAVGVLLATNIVRMAFYLVLSLSATAGLFFLAGADFVGSMQLMIYVGGTLVLLIFGVMLTSQERFLEMKTWAGDWSVALLAGGALLALLISAALSIPQWQGIDRAEAEAVPVAATAAPLGMGLLGIRVDVSPAADVRAPASELTQIGDNATAQGPASAKSIGLHPDSGKSGYLLLFEIVSVHLLVVLIGAAFLARAKRKRSSIAG